MPGNTIKINGFDGLEWYIGDSRVDELIEFLNEIGIKQGEKNMRIPQAIKDKVIVKVIPDDKKTEGGLYIPENAQTQLPQATCEVLSVGEDVDKIKPGNTIICHPHAGQDIYVDGVIMKCLIDGEIYGTLG